MKTIIKLTIITGVLISISISVFAQNNQDTTAYYMSKFKEDLEFIITEKPYKGGAITVFKDGQYWSTSYGIKTEGVNADHEDRFIFRSFTKTLVATVIFQLKEEGLLNIDNPYTDYIEPISRVDTTLTLRELLSMKANTCEFVSNSWDIIDQDPSAIYDVREVLEQAIPEGECNTAKEVKYTNTNYMVLGLVMEEVVGKPGEEIFQDRFVVASESESDTTFYPWVIEDGIFELAPIDIDPASLNGVWVDNGNPSDRYGWSLNGVLTAQKYAGSVVGTTEQMLRILNAILTPDVLLSQESLEEMQIFENNYGLGLMSYDLNNYVEEDLPMKIVGHFGAGLNSSATFMFPEYGYSISIALNMTRSNQADTFFDGIANLVYNFSYLFYCEQGGGCANIYTPNPLEGIIKDINTVKETILVQYLNWDGVSDTSRYLISPDFIARDANNNSFDLIGNAEILDSAEVEISWEWDNKAGAPIAKSLVVDRIVTSNEEGDDNIQRFHLSQNYPNPFNPSTNISFELPQAGLVQLKVYNLLGQEVARLVDGKMNIGNHSIRFDASELSSGIYIYRLVTGSHSISKKMLLIK